MGNHYLCFVLPDQPRIHILFRARHPVLLVYGSNNARSNIWNKSLLIAHNSCSKPLPSPHPRLCLLVQLRPASALGAVAAMEDGELGLHFFPFISSTRMRTIFTCSFNVSLSGSSSYAFLVKYLLFLAVQSKSS